MTSARIIESLEALDDRDWAGLNHHNNPFVSLAFLCALEASGAIAPTNGWAPHHLALYEGDDLLAIAPSYLKGHSRGEFVFDWSWADAYRRHGLPYYPKLLTAVPWSPVTGPRLLVRSDHADPGAMQRELVSLAISECERLKLSSWHCNFCLEEEAGAFDQPELLARRDCQFHWQNRGYDSFEEFLATLRSKKRKNIRRERRAVAEAGIQFRWKGGDELNSEDLEVILACYRNTFHQYGNIPSLNRAFFTALARDVGSGLQLALAKRDGAPLAMGLFLAGGKRLYGRYWGCFEEVPGLHFETCYYQGIEFCIRHGLDVFESGAQGEHKVKRGFEPSTTRSFHFIRDPRFRSAIAHFLERESEWVGEYERQLEPALPFHRDQA